LIDFARSVVSLWLYGRSSKLLMNLPEEWKVGRYRILSELGRGGMGTVYLAEDMSLDRKVALKMLSVQFSNDVKRMRRFLQEARAASALNHPSIITIYEVGLERDSHYIATEYIDGLTLRQHMPGIGKRPDQVVDVAIQVASALAAAHAAGIVHRDIKPENIMVRPDGLVKVLDFGIAKLTNQGAAEADGDAPTIIIENTEPGMVMGTASYMSPEQARGLAVDPRTDIFSLGIVLYEMLAGRAPFEGETPSDVMAAILRSQPPPLSQYAPHAPLVLEAITGKALEKDRALRYQSAADMLVDLRGLKQEIELGAKLAGTMPLDGSPSGAFAASRRRRARRTIDSLAVLPLVNSGGDPDSEYLSDGITESLINNLSKLPKLRVMARATVFRYKGREADPREVGRALDISAVLTGRVLHRGESFVINVELVDSSDGTRLWGEHYNRRLTDIIAVEEEIASEITEQLRLKLSSGEKKLLKKRHTDNTEAYQLYLKGRYHWNKRNAEGYKKGVEFFERAIGVDPTYALAYAGLSDCYNLVGQYLLMPPKEAFPKAKQAATRALEIDDTLAEAHTALATIKLYYDWDWAGAEQEFKRAVELNVSYATTHQRYAEHLMYSGLHDKALAEIKRAQELDPLSLSINASVGWVYYNARQTDFAIEQLQKTMELDPDFLPARFFLGQAYEQKGLYEESLRELSKAVALSGRSPTVLAILGRGYAVTGKIEEALQVADELSGLCGQGYDASYYIATIYAGLGDADRTFDCLNKACREREAACVYLKVDPRFDNLRSDTRFGAICNHIHQGVLPF
jgi:serine/threonine protein kinase/tetratricopeptide (TPR) repeat protein